MRAEYVPDDKQDIIETVLRLKERVGENGVIFSSGGIGHFAALFPSTLPALRNQAIPGVFKVSPSCSANVQQPPCIRY